MSDTEYPRMLFRQGTQLALVEGNYDTITVHSAEQESDARAEGYSSLRECLNALDHDGDGKSGGSIPARRRSKQKEDN